MKIDPSKKYTTRDGRPVKFLHRAPEGWPGEYPWRGFVDKLSRTWDDDGREFSSKTNTPSDLVEVREPLEVRLVIDGRGEIWGLAEENTAKFYDRSWPSDAPHRIATFVEKQPTIKTP